jgi:hypothetical protein
VLIILQFFDIRQFNETSVLCPVYRTQNARLIPRQSLAQCWVHIRSTKMNTVEILHYGMAKRILGKDFISPEEIAESHQEVVYTNAQLAKFNNTVPSQQVLSWCRENNYMVVAGPHQSLSLLEVRALWKDYFHMEKGGWYAKQEFAEMDKVETNWIMLRKGPVPESFGLNWREQLALLSTEEIVPNIAEVAWCAIAYNAVLGMNLLANIFVRTASCDMARDHTKIGSLNFGKLDIGFFWNIECCNNLGLSSRRK